MRATLADSGYDITPPLDRCYYQAAYFQAPGGLRLALATEEPGFLIDETAETLGENIQTSALAPIGRWQSHTPDPPRGSDECPSAYRVTLSRRNKPSTAGNPRPVACHDQTARSGSVSDPDRAREIPSLSPESVKGNAEDL
jgi:hypothetical protein